MFEVGFSEMMVIFIVALIVLGPEKLPKVARFIGFWIGRLRAYAHQAQEEFNQHVPMEEVRQFKTEMENTAYQLEYNLKNPHYQEMLRQQELNKENHNNSDESQKEEPSPQTELNFEKKENYDSPTLSKKSVNLKKNNDHDR